MTISFKGPYTKKELNDRQCLDKKAYGIYIWGFSYSLNSNGELKLIEEINQLNDLDIRKIPYYVGITGDSIYKTIMGRHINQIIKPCSTYLRLTRDYLNKYFRDNAFPERSAPRKTWIKKQTNKSTFFDPDSGHISYINEAIFFQNKQHIQNVNTTRRKHYPMCLLTPQEKVQRDTYSFLKQDLQCFFFMYADLNNSEFKKLAIESRKSENSYLEIFEAYTKFCLQGKTIGDCKFSQKSMIESLEDLNLNNLIKINLSDKLNNDITKDYFLPFPRTENKLDPGKLVYGLPII